MALRRLITHEKFYYFDVGVFRKLRPLGRLDCPSEIKEHRVEDGILIMPVERFLGNLVPGRSF